MRKFSPVWWVPAVLALSACHAPSSSASQPLFARLYLETKPGEPFVPVELPQSRVIVSVAPRPVFSEYDISDAGIARVDLGLCVILTLTPAAARDWYRLSVPAQGRRLVLSLNEVVLGVHLIEGARADGVVPVFLEVPDERLPELVKQLKNTATGLARGGQKNIKQ